MRRTHDQWTVMLCIVLGATTGCAVVPEPTATPAPVPAAAPAPEVTVGTTATGGGISSRERAAARVNTAPDAQALMVLEAIPEPIPEAQRVPPPDQVLRDHPPALPQPTHVAAGTAVLLADASGSARDSAASDTTAADTAFIPVPAPTKPLGQRERERAAVADSLLRAAMGDTAGSDSAGARATGGAAAAPAVAAAAPVHPDSCWRVQVAAPDDTARANSLRRASESLLVVPMVVEEEDGRHKVRTRDCFNAVNANRLRLRADASGFPGAFRFKPKR